MPTAKLVVPGNTIGEVERYVRSATGTCYRSTTSEAVVAALEHAIAHQYRVRLFYGDTATGVDWCDDDEVLGYVTRTYGSLLQRPALLPHPEHPTGAVILDSSIVRIMGVKTKQELYRHPWYRLPRLWITPDNVVMAQYHMIQKEIARYPTQEAAEHYVEFLRGTRMKKC